MASIFLFVIFVIFVIFLVVATAHVMAWLMSFCCKRQGDAEEVVAYTNPYRIVPRKEHENYKRYERQMYLDSLRK